MVMDDVHEQAAEDVFGPEIGSDNDDVPSDDEDQVISSRRVAEKRVEEMTCEAMAEECEKRDPLVNGCHHTVKGRPNTRKFVDHRPATAHHAKKDDWMAWLLELRKREGVAEPPPKKKQKTATISEGSRGATWTASCDARLIGIITDPTRLADWTRYVEGMTRQQLDIQKGVVTTFTTNPCFGAWMDDFNNPGVNPALEELTDFKQTYPEYWKGICTENKDSDENGCPTMRGDQLHSRLKKMRAELTSMKAKLTLSGTNEAGWDVESDAASYAREKGDDKLLFLWKCAQTWPDFFNKMMRLLPGSAKVESGVAFDGDKLDSYGGGRGSPLRIDLSSAGALFKKSAEELEEARTAAKLNEAQAKKVEREADILKLENYNKACASLATAYEQAQAGAVVHKVRLPGLLSAVNKFAEAVGIPPMDISDFPL